MFSEAAGIHSMGFEDRRLQPSTNPFLHYSMPSAAKRVHSYAGYVPYHLAKLMSSRPRRLSSDDPMQNSVLIASDADIQRGAQRSIAVAEAAWARASIDISESTMEHLPELLVLQSRYRSPQACHQMVAAKGAMNQSSVKPSMACGMRMATPSTEASSVTNSAESTPLYHRRCHRSAPAELSHFDSVGDLSHGFAGANEKTTTVMVRNLPSTICLKALIKEIHSSGFKGRFDFCFMPINFSTGRSQGFAFVNFLTAEVARCFFR
eukprot:CAMPEP_0170588938 /NCGR_PEP_ID=MMETSP0224-20130122/11094_1 /TAXON_ID=285029 /ORGANISM="Togula jolla, Strain CCCM 725" /LENGTH=263 /DNA_ID=CAMNT_0010912683 /DNA_START=30 /DNA_END=818 /DNA_ORIENTATION=+